jgi:hypothetical protein
MSFLIFYLKSLSFEVLNCFKLFKKILVSQYSTLLKGSIWYSIVDLIPKIFLLQKDPHSKIKQKGFNSI